MTSGRMCCGQLMARALGRRQAPMRVRDVLGNACWHAVLTARLPCPCPSVECVNKAHCALIVYLWAQSMALSDGIVTKGRPLAWTGVCATCAAHILV